MVLLVIGSVDGVGGAAAIVIGDGVPGISVSCVLL